MSDAGAYGLTVAGLPAAAAWMQPPMNGAPRMDIRVEVGPTDDSPSRVDRDSADLHLVGGVRLRSHRGHETAVFRSSVRPPDTDLLHPYLGAAAALRWRWSGHEVLHAGAFVSAAGAVLVLGDKEAGKSTTLAWLASVQGVTIMSDDLAVLRENWVMAGPRALDLRPGVGARPGELEAAAADGEWVRHRQRLRLHLGPAPAELPVAGLVRLEWGPSVEVVAVPFSERLSLLGAQRSFPGLDTDPVAVLDLGTVPMVRLRRPRTLSCMPAVGRLLDQVFT